MLNLSFPDACNALALPQPSVRNWLLRREFNFADQGDNRRLSFSPKGLLGIAIGRDLIRCGTQPGTAFRWARSIVERSGAPPKPVDVVADPTGERGFVLVPSGSQHPIISRAAIILNIQEIWREIEARLPQNRGRAA